MKNPFATLTFGGAGFSKTCQSHFRTLKTVSMKRPVVESCVQNHVPKRKYSISIFPHHRQKKEPPIPPPPHLPRTPTPQPPAPPNHPARTPSARTTSPCRRSSGTFLVPFWTRFELCWTRFEPVLGPLGPLGPPSLSPSWQSSRTPPAPIRTPPRPPTLPPTTPRPSPLEVPLRTLPPKHPPRSPQLPPPLPKLRKAFNGCTARLA